MRILVVSDTHGDMFTLRKAVLSQPQAEVIIHCGDGEEQSVWLSRILLIKWLLQLKVTVTGVAVCLLVRRLPLRVKRFLLLMDIFTMLNTL